MTARYRAEQVGSLLRPPELLQARAAHLEGRLTREELRSIEDRSILHALEKQRELGLGIFTDGEMRRGSWLTDMADAVEGFVPQKVELEWKGPGGGREGSTALAAGAKLRKVRKLTGHEMPFIKKAAPGAFKITVPAPSNFLVASYKAGITDKFYPTYGEFLEDLVEIIRDEISGLSPKERHISNSTLRITHTISIPGSVNGCSKLAVIRTKSLTKQSPETIPVLKEYAISLSRSTFAGATAAAAGIPKAATKPLRKTSSVDWMLIRFCWNTTPRVLEDSSHCVWCLDPRMSCWVSSRPKSPNWNLKMN